LEIWFERYWLARQRNAAAVIVGPLENLEEFQAQWPFAAPRRATLRTGTGAASLTQDPTASTWRAAEGCSQHRGVGPGRNRTVRSAWL